MSKSADLITIGDLAERTGVGAATIRAWEQRHGFPTPLRLPSGHRRYDAHVVELVRDVVRLRDGGRRLDLAIAEATTALSGSASQPPSGSVYAELRRAHPALVGHRLRKSTLIALSWAIEDEFAAQAARPVLFGAFQDQEFYDRSRPRWRELARVARDAVVFADFPVTTSDSAPREVALGPDSPMHREWTVVSDSVELPAALAAWELPGQTAVADRDRIFEAVWTVEPRAVRHAARTCARIAGEHGDPGAPALLHALAEDPRTGVADLASVSTLFNRVVAYVDAVSR
ncbi:MerR family DNA-binding transcriptional regulator [Nocardioides sp. CGMCC 1.13656]|nr:MULTISPECIES: DICT sensory domain-containing protein [unclassified Nocardioides]MBA2956414.1 MerR family DNA-binding transcriptional regulator [Nocardioides sp. CGMCC 1.13656]